MPKNKTAQDKVSKILNDAYDKLSKLELDVPLVNDTQENIEDMLEGMDDQYDEEGNEMAFN